jgi:hypothetical protein
MTPIPPGQGIAICPHCHQRLRIPIGNHCLIGCPGLRLDEGRVKKIADTRVDIG